MSTATPALAAARPADDAAAGVQVFKWIIEGQHEADIRDALASTFPTADPGAVLAAVVEQFRTAAGAEPDVVYGWCVEATRDLYRRMVEAGDYAGALRAVKQLHDLVSRHVPQPDRDADPRSAEAAAEEVRGEEGP